MGKDKKRKNAATMRRIKSIAAVLAASMIGVNTTGIVAAIVAYNSVFPRYERPDYSLYPGMYDYSRYGDSLPRRELCFTSAQTALAAYYYPCEGAKGLVTLVHGFHAGADDYLPLAEALVNSGYAVFTYDSTGTYSSEGDSGVGMCQALIDLDSALNFLKSDRELSSYPLYLVGHSLGGYAAASVLALHSEVKACALIAPMCSGAKVMIDMSVDRVGAVAYATKPVFDLYQRYLFGSFVDYDAIRGINSTDAHVLIVQGLSDEIITHDGHSVTARADEITNPNVEIIYTEGLRGGHDGVWHSDESCEYRRELDEKLNALSEERGRELTDSEKAEFYSTVDHRLYSEVDGELVRMIVALFEK